MPEIGLDPTEANELMGATQNVLRHYSIETTQKGADYIALVGVVTMMFGTRVGAYNLRKRMEREKRQSQMPPNVIRMPQASVAPQPAPSRPAPAAPAQPDMSPRPEPDYGDANNGF